MIIGLVFLLMEWNIYCVICSLFKDKDFCEYFEVCMYKWLIDIYSFMLKMID